VKADKQQHEDTERD